MNNTVVVENRFDITEYEEEQFFLEDMHRQGWCFCQKQNGFINCKYTFVACVPEEMVYRIDYHPKALKQNPDYLTMFWDCGWESCYIHNGFVIFRKPKRLMTENEDIYTDNEGRLSALRRRLSIHLPLAVLNMILSILNLCTNIRTTQHSGDDLNGVLGVGIWLCIAAAWIILIIRYIVKYIQLKNRTKE